MSNKRESTWFSKILRVMNNKREPDSFERFWIIMTIIMIPTGVIIIFLL